MTQGNIVAWRKNEGDSIGPGDILAEVETDKATIEWEAQEEGFLARILAPNGSRDVPVGQAVAILVEEAADVAAFKDFTPGAAASPKAAAAPPPPPQAAAPAAAPSSSFPPHEVLAMPALSPTMTQGNIVLWHKAVGDTIAAGDMLAEVETDKATIGWEAQEEGYLAAILAPDGSKDVPVGSPTAVLVEDKDLVAAFASFTAADAAGVPAAKPAAAAPPPPPPPRPSPTSATAPPPPKAAAPAPPAGGRVGASPYAKKLAAEAGVSLAGVAGSGPGGRIVAADVERLVASGGGAAPAATPAAATPGTPAPAGSWADVPVSQIQRVTAARLLESKQTVPHYYLTMEVQVDELLALREQVNKSLASAAVVTGSDAAKLSVNDFIIKAAALALRKVPALNSSWMGDSVRTYHSVDINVAVQTPVGLMVPFVRGADSKGLAAISAEVKELAAKAKAGKLAPSEFQGGTFTISNLGMYGVRQFAAIINPPQAGILAVGAAHPKVLKADNGSWKQVSALLVTLSADHRVVDGAVGAGWLQAFKGYIENPLTMIV